MPPLTFMIKDFLLRHAQWFFFSTDSELLLGILVHFYCSILRAELKWNFSCCFVEAVGAAYLGNWSFFVIFDS